MATVDGKTHGKKALVIGGGAPNSSLIAGALVAFIDCGMEFDVISTSGAGALMGLLYVAPRNGNPRLSLERWGHGGVSDEIYNAFPVNYKIFSKPGPAAQAFRDSLATVPWLRPYVDMFAPDAIQGPWADWVQLCLATLSPTNLTPGSLGMCAHLPFAEDAIDFDAIKKIKQQVYINAYNLTKERMAIWDKSEITVEHFKAAFAFPFIYPPYHIDGCDYIEGASIDSLNFEALISDDEKTPGVCRDIDRIVVFDILGNQNLLQKPRDLYDSWVRSIITPLVRLSKDDLRMFERFHNIDPKTGKPKRKVFKVPLTSAITKEQWPKVLDWSYSNLKNLYDIGYKAGIKFCEQHQKDFSDVKTLKEVA